MSVQNKMAYVIFLISDWSLVHHPCHNLLIIILVFLQDPQLAHFAQGGGESFLSYEYKSVLISHLFYGYRFLNKFINGDRWNM